MDKQTKIEIIMSKIEGLIRHSESLGATEAIYKGAKVMGHTENQAKSEIIIETAVLIRKQMIDSIKKDLEEL